MEKIIADLEDALEAFKAEKRRTPHLATTEALVMQARDRLAAHVEWCVKNPPPSPVNNVTAPAAAKK